MVLVLTSRVESRLLRLQASDVHFPIAGFYHSYIDQAPQTWQAGFGTAATTSNKVFPSQIK
jgi:hypothetical protein